MSQLHPLRCEDVGTWTQLVEPRLCRLQQQPGQLSAHQAMLWAPMWKAPAGQLANMVGPWHLPGMPSLLQVQGHKGWLSNACCCSDCQLQSGLIAAMLAVQARRCNCAAR